MAAPRASTGHLLRCAGPVDPRSAWVPKSEVVERPGPVRVRSHKPRSIWWPDPPRLPPVDGCGACRQVPSITYRFAASTADCLFRWRERVSPSCGDPAARRITCQRPPIFLTSKVETPISCKRSLMPRPPVQLRPARRSLPECGRGAGAHQWPVAGRRQTCRDNRP